MKTKLIFKKEIAQDTLEFCLEKPQNFSFRPGQHCEIKILNPQENDERGQSKILSIVSSPNENQLCFATRLGPSAFKKNLANLQIGDILEINGPYGSMLLPQQDEKPLIFFAGGIGITPFISMIRFILKNNLKHQIYLFYSNHNKNTTAYFEELNTYASQNKIKAFFIMTDFNAKINKEIILENISQEILKNSIFYIAGPVLFNKAIIEILENLAVDEEKIKFEDFAGY